MKDLIKTYQKLVKRKDIGNLERKSYQRQIDDLKKKDFSFHFDLDKANRVCNFLEKLKHVKGELAGQYLKLEDWQKYGIVYPLYGWVDDQGYRRYRTAYMELARKSGKSFLLSGLGLYGLAFDGEGGSEVVAISTKTEQSKLIFDVSDAMRKKSKGLSKRIKTTYSTMRYKDSTFKPLGADAKTLDGLNLHMILCDEYHEHKNSNLLDVCTSSMGARRQPLTLIITTAGFSRHCACYDERTYALNVLAGLVDNDRYFIFITTIDDGDDPFDPKVWRKANPNLGVATTMESFAEVAKEAQQKGSTAMNNFLTKRLNVWTDTASTWIKEDDFMQGKDKSFTEESLHGETCHAGIDLGKVSDMTSYSLVFPQDDHFKVIAKNFIPQEAYDERTLKGDNIYAKFVEEGSLIVTEGNVTDYRVVKEYFLKDCENFDVATAQYDKYMSSQIIVELAEECDTEFQPFGQSILNMSPPTKTLERLLLLKDLWHNNNALMKWSLSQVEIITDISGNIKISKSASSYGSGGSTHSSAKVDVWVATVMGLARASIESYLGETEASFFTIDEQ